MGGLEVLAGVAGGAVGVLAGGAAGAAGERRRRRAAAPGGASPRAARGPPSAGRTAPSGCRGTAPRASRPAGPGRSAARPRTGIASSVNGSESRSSSSTSSGARPSSSSLIERRWISLSRSRLASSSGSRRTSSSSCLIMLPIRITLAGCSTSSVTERSSTSSSPGGASTAIPSGPTTTTRGSRRRSSPLLRPVATACCSLMPPSSPTAPARNAWTPAARGRQAGGMPATTATHRRLGPDDLDAVCDAARGVRPRRPSASSTSPGTRSPPTWPRPPSRAPAGTTGRAPSSATAGCGASSAPTRSSSTSTCGRRPTTVSVTRCWRTSSTAAASWPPRRATPQPWVGIGVYRQDARTRGWLLAARLRRADHVHPDAHRPRPGPAAPEQPAADVTRPPDHRGGRPPRWRTRSRRSRSSSTTATCRPPTRAGWSGSLDRGDGLAGTSTSPSSTATPVGLLTSTRQFEEDEDAGYVRTLGVLPAARGRGRRHRPAAGLLRRAHREGRRAVLLHVDVANVTGALRVYESVGMRAGARDRRLGQGRAAVDAVDADTPLCGGLVRGSPRLRQPAFGQQSQGTPARGAPLPAYVGHDSRLTIGSRDRVATATTTARQQRQRRSTRPQRPAATARRGSGRAAARRARPCVPAASDELVSGYVTAMPGHERRPPRTEHRADQPDRQRVRRRHQPSGPRRRRRRHPSSRSRAGRRTARGTSRSACRRAPARAPSTPSTSSATDVELSW